MATSTNPSAGRLWAVVCLLVGLSLTGLPGAQASRPATVHFEKWPSGNFGYVLVGERHIKKFTLRNDTDRRTGVLRVAVTGSDSLRAPAWRNHCQGVDLRPGATCRVTIRYTPEKHYDAALTRFVSDAHGRVTVTSERRPRWSTTKRLSGVGDTPATRVARPTCEAIGGSLGLGQILDLWRCDDWGYGDQATFDFRRGLLEALCNLTGGITLWTPPDGITGTSAVSVCTNEGG